jgi:hypothetical protein
MSDGDAQFGLSSSTYGHFRPRVAYIWFEQLEELANALPANLGRSSMVHSLINALGLVKRNDLDVAKSDDMRATVIAPDLRLGTAEALKKYHDAKYVGMFSFSCMMYTAWFASIC